MDRGAWQATVHGATKNLTYTHHLVYIVSKQNEWNKWIHAYTPLRWWTEGPRSLLDCPPNLLPYRASYTPLCWWNSTMPSGNMSTTTCLPLTPKRPCPLYKLGTWSTCLIIPGWSNPKTAGTIQNYPPYPNCSQTPEGTPLSPKTDLRSCAALLNWPLSGLPHRTHLLKNHPATVDHPRRHWMTWTLCNLQLFLTQLL